MEPQTTILVILALCITLLVLIFAVGYSAGIAHAQKMGSRILARATGEKKPGAAVPMELYPGPSPQGLLHTWPGWV
jgi:hypothetical protein